MVNFHKNGNDKHVTGDMIALAKKQIDQYMAKIPQYDVSKYSGRGIVMIAGGAKYIPCAYVNVKMIRSNGCTLPIELWYIGAYEMDDTAKALFAGMAVTFVDCMDKLAEVSSRRIGGWEMNPYSIIHSSFQEVVFLDADNVPLIDVETMFDWPGYQNTGAVFWPDYNRLPDRRSIWKLLQIPYQDESEFESGQIVVDKRKCWKELHLTMCLNEYSDTYYRHVWGDKETYHMAWRYLQREYTMVPHGIHKLRATMVQHDMDGKKILQHRNMDKFKLEKTNARINGFQREGECFKYLNELRGTWDGTMKSPLPVSHNELEAAVALSKMEVEYRLGDQPPRILAFSSDGTIGKGSMTLERRWYVRERADGMHLYICRNGMVTADTLRQEDGTWKGQWIGDEMFSVHLVPTGAAETAKMIETTLKDELQGKRYEYVRIGFDRTTCKLIDNNKTVGLGANERAWWTQRINEVDVLCIAPAKGAQPICMLQEGRDGIWRGYWTKHEKMGIELIPQETKNETT